MTEKEILEQEKDNYTTVHLHLVGIFWRVCQLCMKLYLKRMGGI